MKLSKFTLPALCLSALCAVTNAYSAQDKLVIWTKQDFGNKGVEQLAKAFTAKTGMPVEVYMPETDEPTVDYNQLVVLGKGPDIFLRAHDRVGELAEAGLIAKVTPSKSTLNSIDKAFWNAVRYEGDYYGYPISVEGVTQVCNAKLVNNTYKNMAAVERDAGKSVKPLMWHYYDNYFSYGFITSEGGYAFKNEQGTYNPGLTGVNSKGAIAGIKSVKRLIDKKALPLKMDYGIFHDAFKQEKVACIINGPWAWPDYQKQGIELLIGNLPSVNRGSPQVFTGVLTAVINPASPNKALAQSFMEDYFLQPSGLKMVNDVAPLGAVTNTKFMAELAKQNPLLAAAHEVWKKGEPMPNIPKMAVYWTHMDTALIEVYKNNVPVKQALTAAAHRITR